MPSGDVLARILGVSAPNIYRLFCTVLNKALLVFDFGKCEPFLGRIISEKSKNSADLFKRQSRPPILDCAVITKPDVAKEICGHRCSCPKQTIYSGRIEPRHRATVQAHGSRRHDQEGRLQTAVSQGSRINQIGLAFVITLRVQLVRKQLGQGSREGQVRSDDGDHRCIFRLTAIPFLEAWQQTFLGLL